MSFPDSPTMYLGCSVYGFNTWDDAYQAADEFTEFAPNNHDEFERWLKYLKIEFTVVSRNCGERA